MMSPQNGLWRIGASGIVAAVLLIGATSVFALRAMDDLIDTTAWIDATARAMQDHAVQNPAALAASRADMVRRIERQRSDAGTAAIATLLGSVLAFGLALASAHLLRRDSLARRQAERRFRSLLESAPDAILIIDPQGRILLGNAQVSAMFGWSRQELQGQPVEILVPDALRAAHVGKRETYMDKPSVRPLGTGLELLAQRRDGSLVPVDICLSTLEGTGESRDAVIAVIRDVSARKVVEEALRASNAEVTDLYENAPCGYHSLDAQGRVRRINDTELGWLGVTRQAVLGKPFAQFLDARGRASFATGLAALFRNGRVDNAENELLRADGTVLPVLVNATTVYDAEGGVLHTRTTLLDRTELKQAQDQREALIAELKDALARVKTLHGLLPICAWCKNIRDEQGDYLTLEAYVTRHSEAEFTHGICPECARKVEGAPVPRHG